jgi:cytochrome c556
MRNSVRLAVAGLALAGIVGIAAGVPAQDKAAAVKLRQDTMKQQAGDLKYIATFAKGGGGDQATAVQKAEDLHSLSAKLPTLFPPGTSNADLPDAKTYAKPNIWTDQDNFKAIVAKLPGLELTLVDAVKSGEKPKILAAIGNLGKNGCGACHSTYRAKMPQQ